MKRTVLVSASIRRGLDPVCAAESKRLGRLARAENDGIPG